MNGVTCVTGGLLYGKALLIFDLKKSGKTWKSQINIRLVGFLYSG